MATFESKGDEFIPIILASKKWKVTASGIVFQRERKGWVEAGHFSHDGYRVLRPRLPDLGFRPTIRIHRLVYAAFVGELDPYLVIHHKNNLRDDNQWDNLELITNEENNRLATCGKGKSRRA